MADLKTSEETSGYPLQKNDLHRIARSGNNHKVTSEELFSEVLTYTQFETKRTSGNLIAGRWYKVAECGYDLNQTILVLADTNISFNPRIKWLSAPNNTVECDAIELNQDFVRYYDNHGNNYGGYSNFCAELPPLGGGNWYNVEINNVGNCCFTNINDAINVSNSILQNVTQNWTNVEIKNSKVNGLNDGGIANPTWFVIDNCDISNVYYENGKSGGQVAIQNCKLEGVEIYFYGDSTVTLSQLNLKNCVLYINDEVLFAKSTINNATIEILNGPVDVQNLQVFGKGEQHTSYRIDGTLQSQVLNNWAGIVVADTRDEINTERCGYSTVKMKLLITNDFSSNQGIYDYTSNAVYLAEQSVVGIYLFDTIPQAIFNVNEVNESTGHCQHEIKFSFLDNSNNGEINFNFQTIRSNITAPFEMVAYHGKTNKVGKLLSKNDSITLKNQWNESVGFTCWFLVYGVHYD